MEVFIPTDISPHFVMLHKTFRCTTINVQFNFDFSKAIFLEISTLLHVSLQISVFAQCNVVQCWQRWAAGAIFFVVVFFK